MSNEQNNEQQTVSHAEAKLAELREDLTKALEKAQKIQDKIDGFEREQANAAQIEALAAGQQVAYVYGRALNKRVLSGTVRYVGKNDKGALLLKVETGEGFDIETHLIDAASLLLSNEDIQKANAELEAARTEAAAKAAEAKPEGAE